MTFQPGLWIPPNPNARHPSPYIAGSIAGLAAFHSAFLWCVILTWPLAVLLTATSAIAAAVGLYEARRTGAGWAAAWWGLGLSCAAVAFSCLNVWNLTREMGTA
ncbi:hypothetical protein ACFC0M_16775 [Streptomyces sp. NPDC056149]|uniref:hypothetical protein n=1 Tax=unclassified Streptomyces TaxID=2593676 RepID=UPI0023816288|nr:hypothetical protein [Streptomyces sp. WZ-12]